MVGGPSEGYASSGAAVFCAGMNPLSLKDLLKGCLLVAFFENLPVLLLLIKRAALGIVQANLTLLSFAQPFPSGDKGCANRPFNSLYDPFGSPCRGQKRSSNRYAIRLADHQRSTPVFCAGWGTAGTRLAKKWLCGMGPQGQDGWRIA